MQEYEANEKQKSAPSIELPEIRKGSITANKSYAYIN